ncbi:MAG: DUF3189 family protein [Acetobacteraceae bacterium]|nr:DUF3189 family protein [Acetobacteraceae bacterium]
MVGGRGLVVYHCYGGAHSSVVAAAIHLGLLPSDRPPLVPELDRLRLFDFQPRSAHGHLWLLGRDAQGRGVYVLARRGCGRVVERALRDLAQALGHQPPRLVDTMPAVNWALRVGGFASRTLGLWRLGRPLLTWGVRRAYPRLRHLAGVGCAVDPQAGAEPPPGSGVNGQ